MSAVISTKALGACGTSLTFICTLRIWFDLDTIVLGIWVPAHRNVCLLVTVYSPMMVGRSETTRTQVCWVLHAEVCWQQVIIYGWITIFYIRFNFDTDGHRGCHLMLLLYRRCWSSRAHLLTEKRHVLYTLQFTWITKEPGRKESTSYLRYRQYETCQLSCDGNPNISNMFILTLTNLMH